MKLLLVDDEVFTREGILSILRAGTLEFAEILTASNGREGLEAARKAAPEIILTDVKMPHMDGIAMASEIRRLFPDCCIIFMSGYADKKYLKSAIRLSAINYIEKPFTPEELFSTLQLAAEKIKNQQAALRSSDELTKKLDISLPALQSNAALYLTAPPDNAALPLQETLSLAFPNLSPHGIWATVLLRFTPLPDGNFCQERVRTALSGCLRPLCGADFLMGWKEEYLLVLQLRLPQQDIFSAPSREEQPEGTNADRRHLRTLCRHILECLSLPYGYLAAAGIPVHDFGILYESYRTATIALQRGFFHPNHAVLFADENDNARSYRFSDAMLDEFDHALRRHQEENACTLIRTLTEKLRSFDGTLVSSVKHFYIDAALRLYAADRLCKSHTFPDDAAPENIRDAFWKLSSLTALEESILTALRHFFHSTDETLARNPLAHQIRLFLDEHYAREDLSLQEIADLFSVSESYLCVLYKKAFDCTINQYLIDRRMEKAKLYLKNSNKKIMEIAALVGYRDCNYFIRLFKKNTGQTPTEFRDI